MSLRSQFKTDPKAVVEGVWHSFDANPDGSIPRFLVARTSFSNPKYAKAVSDAKAKNGDRTLSEEQERQQNNEIFLSVLLNWEHVQPEDDGVELPFSNENAEKLLLDPHWFDLLIELRGKAMATSSFLAHKQEAIAKNS